MAAVLSAVVGVTAGAYVLPHAADFLYSYGMSGIGATVLLWGVVALLYDFAVNMAPDDGFSEFDAALTLALTVALRLTGYLAPGR